MVEQQLAGLRSVAPNAANVRMSVLVPTSSEACSGVNLGAGYLELAADSDGAIENLCDEDWSNAFAAFADASIVGQVGEVQHLLQQVQVNPRKHPGIFGWD